jgi:hypothetical protein
LGSAEPIQLIVGEGDCPGAIASIGDLRHTAIIHAAALVVAIAEIKQRQRDRRNSLELRRFQTVVESVSQRDGVPAGHRTVNPAGEHPWRSILWTADENDIVRNVLQSGDLTDIVVSIGIDPAAGGMSL